MGLFTMYQNRKRVLGLNERGLRYIRKYNKPSAIEIADNKLSTKEVLNAADIPTPKLIDVIPGQVAFENFDWTQLPKSFVMKPVMGLEGGGIELLYNKDKEGRWIKSDKSKVDVDDLKQKGRGILEGRYSLYNAPDTIMFEERIKPHKSFKYYTYKGTPDVRVIVFNKIPVMAMLRLPTRESEGKANLDKGAIGVGIDIAKGATTNAIQGKAGEIEFIPGTRLRVSGLKIPYWNQILEYAIRAQEATGLYFAGIDFLIDRDQGPVIVEMNARPGLSIQLANEDGLRWRLGKAAHVRVKTHDKGIRLAKDLFGGEIDEEIASVSGKEVIGIYENVSLINTNGQELQTKAKIDTGADSTSVDVSLAHRLGYSDLIERWNALNLPAEIPREEGKRLEKELQETLVNEIEELVDVQYVRSSHGSSLRPYIRLNMRIKDTLFETKASLYDRSKLTYPVIVGRKSLTRFLVDPSKRRTSI
ncbi:MAG: Ribosomal protein S6--L-glutamate ligase [candidate division WS6 bacterium OLB20]|uniref:Ribosomal protein S6--L-glutamate ligase n=1 Tax=candidate division WS6 bacterium OLB20 TaxID=1617426 RepID=A0A136LYE5_9BACT|nr:MAG: Ribosomal protein S6--L-glutamate ligase [candidate division WS6 bacterium OLB20]